MLTPYLPYPPSSGGQIRSYNIIKNFSKQHEITLFSLIKYDEEEKYVKYLKKYCKDVFTFKRSEKPWTLKNIIKTGFSLFPFLVIRNFSADEKKAIEEILKKEHFDIIHAETFYVGPHIPETDVPVVLVGQTIEHRVYLHFVHNFWFFPLKPLLMIDVLKIKFWESYYWKKAARVIAVSNRDAELMRKLVKDLKVTVVPNGVGEDLMDDIPLHYNQNILFMGNYAWLQNREAINILVKEVFPLIREKLPEATLTIAGQHIEKIRDLEGDGIVFRDLNVEDIEGVKRAYRESGILVAPLYGPGGTRLKILGAMAAKLPVVTTPIGIEGIDAVNNESVLFGQTKKEIAELSIKVLTDKDLYKKIALNSRKLVEEKYTYEIISKQLNEVYKQCLQTSREVYEEVKNG